MPTIITHAVTGLAARNLHPSRQLPLRFWVLTAICPMLPDADSIGFALGIPYAHVFGHRGFFHSLFFAFILALLVTGLFFRGREYTYKSRGLMVLYFFLVTASHGILDTFTNGGLGIALLAPFDNTRFFAPSRPIRVSPIGIRAFFSAWGVRVMLSEIFWVWLPAVVLSLSAWLIKTAARKKKV